jgi:hypothetical protein
MPLGKHSKTEQGRFRRERSDSTARTLRMDYPEVSNVRPDAKLGNIKKSLNLPPDTSINTVHKALREQD